MDVSTLRTELCEVGRRLYQKGFAAANEGNLSARIDENTVLCTPTLFCKGFMQPDDLCLVDMEGNQLEGKRKRTSEVLLHLEIYRQRPDVNSVVHCHPPHATAFAVAREAIPVGILPEPDIFLGEVPIAQYETPGAQAFADTILPLVANTNTIVLANHGTVSFDVNPERAYWLTEILDAYCRILILSKQLGHTEQLPEEKIDELLKLRVDWGFDDSRIEMDLEKNRVADHPKFRPTWNAANVAQRAFGKLNSKAKTLNSKAKTGTDQIAGQNPKSKQEVRLAESQMESLAELIVEKLREG